MPSMKFWSFIMILLMLAGCGKPREYTLAEEAYDKQEYEQAITAYQDFIDKYPDDELVELAREKMSLSYYKLGIMAESNSDETRALQMFKSAMDIDPQNDLLKDKIVTVFVKKGQLFLNAGYYEAAIKYLQQALPYETTNTALANYIADAYFMQGHAFLKAHQMPAAMPLFSKALSTTSDPLKRDKYEQVLVTAANDYLRREILYPAFLYFSVLKELFENQEYANLAEYVRTQIKPVIEHYPTPVRLPNVMEQLSLELSQEGYISGKVTNVSAMGYLAQVWVNIRVFDHGSNQSYFEADHVNLLEGYIGFVNPNDMPSSRVILSLEPLGSRDFVIKTNKPVAPTDIVQIDIVEYTFQSNSTN